MLRTLLIQDAAAGLSSPPPADPKPSTTKPAATPAAKPAGAPASPPAPPPAAPSAPPAPSDDDDPFTPPKKPAAAPGAAPAASAPAAAPAELDYDKLAPKELRDRAKQLRKESEEARSKIKQLEALVKANEGAGRDTSALTSRIQAIEAERDQLLGKIRAMDFKESDEFKKQYDQPFKDEANETRKIINRLRIMNPETGEVVRQADFDKDFAKLYLNYNEDPQGVIEQADAMFGKAAPIVMERINTLQSLQKKQDRALAQEREQFKARNESDAAERAKEVDYVKSEWNKVNTKLTEGVEDYKVDPADTELVEARDFALKAFDAEPKLAPGGDRKEFLTKLINWKAHVRQKVAMSQVLKAKLERSTAKIAELEAQVGELKGAAPRSGRKPGGAEAPTPDSDGDWEKQLKEAVGQA